MRRSLTAMDKPWRCEKSTVFATQAAALVTRYWPRRRYHAGSEPSPTNGDPTHLLLARLQQGSLPLIAPPSQQPRSTESYFDARGLSVIYSARPDLSLF